MRVAVIAVIFSLSAFFSSCCKGGDDGKATVNAFPEHHGAPIYGATVYVKYGAKEQPASFNEYDASYTAGTSDAMVVIDNLKCGDYYFYSTGFDPSIGQAVKGGTPYTITHGARKDQVNIDIPVKED
jgi:hypothetical protein